MRVFLVDDQALMRRGLQMLLSTEPDLEVVGEAGDGVEALGRIAATRPDVVLTDAQMPRMDGVALVAALADKMPGLPVIILTTFDDEALVAGLVAVADGGMVLDPRVARAALTRASEPRAHTPLATLSRAERLVADEVATGATNGEIAQRLMLAEGTVKNHVSSLLRKLDQRDRTGLALLLYRYLGQGRVDRRP